MALIYFLKHDGLGPNPDGNSMDLGFGPYDNWNL